MSVLTIKSDESTSASNKLMQASLFNSSVHCSYYSCVQLMLHILRSHFVKTEDEIMNEGKEGGKTEKGFHNWLQKIIFTEFIKLNSREAAIFNTQIRTLSAARGKADYSIEEVIAADAVIAYETSLKAKTLLQRNFKI